MAPIRPVLVIGCAQRLLRASGEDDVEDFWSAGGSALGSGLAIDLAADPERGLADLGVGSEIPKNGGVKNAACDHDGIVADAGLSH
jgi:hypothetical protein